MNRKRWRIKPISAAVALLLLISLAIFCQTAHRAWTTRHDSYRLLPVAEWGVERGEWDGMDINHHGVGGGIYKYGIIERTTNTQ